MDLPKYLHGSTKGLPKTLAARVSFLRNARRLHIAELAHQARVSFQLLEDIEAGIERWLPTAIRQRIARVLRVDPFVLEEAETKDPNYNELKKNISAELLESIQERILSGIADISCPLCGNKMKTWIQEGIGLNDEKIQSAKGHCTVCVFQLKNQENS